MRLYSMLLSFCLIFAAVHPAFAADIKSHVVLPGDTLGKIAKKHKLTIADLVEFNPQLSNPNALEVGMTLNLEAPPEPEPEVTEKEASTESPAETTKEEASENTAPPPPENTPESAETAETPTETAPETNTAEESVAADESLPELIPLPTDEDMPENTEQEVSSDAEGPVPELNISQESDDTEVVSDPRGLRASLGMIYIQRWGLLRAKSGIQNPPSYFGGIPGFLFQTEFYPQLLFPFLEGEAATHLEKLGFRLESHFASIGTPSDLSKKSHMAGAWAVTSFYRYQFWKGPMAPEIAGGLGYSHFRHPMEDEAYFPGTRYNSLSINGTLDLPLAIGFKIPFIRKLMATGTVTYYPWVGTSGKLKRLGNHDGTLAARIEGGGHMTLDLESVDSIFRDMPIILRAMLRAEYFGSDYKGETSLPTSSQFTKTTLHDMMVGMHITAGILY